MATDFKTLESRLSRMGDLGDKVLAKLRPTVEAGNQAQQSRNDFSSLLNSIIARGQSMADAPALTAEDLFGGQLTRLNDSARQNANALKSAISRSLMSGGGDVTGASGVQLLNIGQAAEQQIGQNELQFARLADQINRANESQGLSLIQSGLSGRNQMMNLDQSVLQQIITRNIQREQAKKQRRNAFLGALLGTGGTILGSALGPGGALAGGAVGQNIGNNAGG